MTSTSHFSSINCVKLCNGTSKELMLEKMVGSNYQEARQLDTRRLFNLSIHCRMETVEVDTDLSPRASLPQFLKPVQSTESSATQVSVPVHAVYAHKHPFGDAHVLWWPAQTQRVCDSSNKTVPSHRTILLFIPGTSPPCPGW